MPKKSNPRQKQTQRARYRTSAAAARARKQKRRRTGIITGSVAGIIIVALVILLLSPTFGSKSASSTSTSSSTTSTPPTSAPPTTAALKSVAGKPCVAMTGTLPKGAPAVPVETGPPPSKLVIKDLKVGTGAVVKATSTLTVDYIGVACSSGKIFDSSYASGQPASFQLSQVIEGWKEGLAGMKVGGERLLGIPPKLAYGATSQGPDIAPNETLWFVVTVHSQK